MRFRILNDSFFAERNSNKLLKTIVAFFNRLAHEKGFHPTEDYAQWYDVCYADVTEYEVSGVMILLGGNRFYMRLGCAQRALSGARCASCALRIVDNLICARCILVH